MPTGRPPRIGVTTYREVAAWGVWNQPADLLPTSYTAAIRSAGALALLLPPDEPQQAGVALDGLDGLLLAGGADIDPERYGTAREPATGPPRPERDAWEIALAREAVTRELPMLGVCRGMQVLNVALGGDLRQHLPDDVGHDGHCPTVGVHGRHAVLTADRSLIAAAVGERADVATYHHQSVDRLGAGLSATGWAEDGVVEAVELGGRSWTVGVQWHPEAFDGARLFAAFVDACRSARTA